MAVSGNVPAMDRPSIAFAHLMDRAVVETLSPEGPPSLVCQDCYQIICDIEPNDTIRVLVNTALAHEC